MNARSGKWLSLVALALSLESCSRRAPKSTQLANGDRIFQSYGKYNEAILQYRSAIQRDPKLAKAHFQLAKAYLATRGLQAAFKEVQTTVDLDPGNVEAQLQYASMLLMAKKYDDAQTVVAKTPCGRSQEMPGHALWASGWR